MQFSMVVEDRRCGVSYAGHMNRIREIRESVHLTQEELADLVGTTGNTISRLELGEQQLTQHWMQLLSEKLGCRPADLIANVVLLETEGEVVDEPQNPIAARAMAAKSMHIYRVTGRSVAEAEGGPKPGDIITVDQSKEAIAALKGMDIVLVTIGKKRSLALRQFIPPNKLITNRDGADINIRLGDPTVLPEIIGVVVGVSDQTA